jgi:hypothetical protein
MEKVDARSQQVVVADKDSVRPQQHVVYFIIVVAAAHVTCTLAMEKVDARASRLWSLIRIPFVRSSTSFILLL